MKARPAEQALERFEAAVRDHAFRGAQHPEDHAAIDDEYALAKAELREHLK